MKYRTTLKSIRNDWNASIIIPYCAAENLLYGAEPVAYAAGVYGWNADVYDVGGGICICTGYRPTGTVRPSHDVIKAADRAAASLIASIPATDYERRRDAVAAFRRSWATSTAFDF